MARAVVLALLLLLSVFLSECPTEAKMVNLEGEAYYIVRRHNQARRSGEVMASNMLEMQWDENLAWEASIWSERCQYRRPTRTSTGRNINANVFFITDHVYGNKTVHKTVDRAISAWRRSRERYTYAKHCERSCSYVQMIMAQADKVGCSLSLCENVQMGNLVVEYGSFLVCYYEPGMNLLNSYPYSRGRACSRCPRGTQCRDKLCYRPGTELVPRRMRPQNIQPRPQAIVEFRDKLRSDERDALTTSHNRMRDGNRVAGNLNWDPYLQRWADWICHCKVDYPGPGHTFTNFERLEQGTNVYNVVSKWAKEEYNRNLRMEHGCRTPKDSGEKCNHFTNLLHGDITSMACAARDCGEGTRQLVCLYDNREQRPVRRRSSSRREPYRPQPYRYSRRRNQTRQQEAQRQRDLEEQRKAQEEQRRREQMERRRQQEAQWRREQEQRREDERRRSYYRRRTDERKI